MKASSALFVAAATASTGFGVAMWSEASPQKCLGCAALAIVWAYVGAMARDFGH